MPNKLFSLIVNDDAALSIVRQSNYYLIQQGQPLADPWQAAVVAAMQSLRLMPSRGTSCHFVHPNLAGFRRIPVSGFEKLYVFYQVHLKSSTVEIVDVMHGARLLEDWLAANIPSDTD